MEFHVCLIACTDFMATENKYALILVLEITEQTKDFG
jgi:hypothetical protein